MTTNGKLQKRIADAESMVIGMGFLLEKCRMSHAGEMSDGMLEQVDHAIRDYRNLAKQMQQRAKSKAGEAR